LTPLEKITKRINDCIQQDMKDREIFTVVKNSSLREIDALFYSCVHEVIRKQRREIALPAERAAMVPIVKRSGTSKIKYIKLTPKQTKLAQEKASKELWQDFKINFKAYGANQKLVLTKEFLESKFSIGNGTQVTWFDATKTDHENLHDTFATEHSWQQ
jgi:hypothetical protein